MSEKMVNTLLKDLSKNDQRQLFRYLKSIFSTNSNQVSLAACFETLDTTKKKKCPHCQSTDIWARGYRNGIRKLTCKKCFKNYSATTGTALFRINNKEKFLAYLVCLEDGLTLRQSAKRVGISLQTSFDWRHKILSSISSIDTDKLTGIIEADEMSLPYSEKGKRNLNRESKKRGSGSAKGLSHYDNVTVLATTDRKKRLFQLAGKGSLKRARLNELWEDRIDNESILCSDGNPSYYGYTRDNGIEHKKIIAYKNKRVLKNRAYHIQTINNYHQQIRNWVQKKFYGVATKYLQNYLNWLSLKKEMLQMKDSLERLLMWVLTDKTAIEKFKITKCDLN